MGWTAKQRQWRIIAIKRRDGMRCWLCHGPFLKGHKVTIDHAIPKAHGGSNELCNLRLAHDYCNHSRGSIESAKAVPAKASGARCFKLAERLRVPA